MARTNYKPPADKKVKSITIRFKLHEYEWIKEQALKQDATSSHLLRKMITPHLFKED